MRVETVPSSRQNPSKSGVQISGRTAMFWILILAAVLAAFGRSVFNDWVDWDDTSLIAKNSLITPPTLEGFLQVWNWNNPGIYAMYNPMVYTTWWALADTAQLNEADIYDTKLNPQIYHAANLLVHWLNACLVFEILRRLKIPDWPAVIGALFFAVHPIQTESVVWATAMKDLLSGFLAMATIWRYLIAVESQGRKRKINYLVSTGLCLLALLAKPSTVVLPLIAIAFDILWYRRPLKTSLTWVSPWLVMVAGASLLARVLQPLSSIDFAAPLWARPLVAADALAFYLYKLAIPINLTFDYGRTPTAVMTDPALH